MRLSLSSSRQDAALSPWAQRLRQRFNLPLLVRWQGGTSLKLGEFDQARVIVDVRDTAGAAALLTPALDNLGQAYVEGHIDVTGSVQDVMDMAHRLAEAGSQMDASGRWVRRVRGTN